MTKEHLFKVAAERNLFKNSPLKALGRVSSSAYNVEFINFLWMCLMNFFPNRLVLHWRW